MIIAPIFLVLCMHIGPIELLENSALNAKFSANRRFHIGSTSLDWDDSTKIKKVITIDKDDKDEKKNP